MRRRTAQPSTSNHVLPLEQCIAKTYQGLDGTIKKGVNVYTHCTIVGCVAKALLSRYSNTPVGELFPIGSELVAAVHDVGRSVSIVGLNNHWHDGIYFVFFK